MFEAKDAIQVVFVERTSSKCFFLLQEFNQESLNAKTVVVEVYATSKPRVWPACWQGEEKKKGKKGLKENS